LGSETCRRAHVESLKAELLTVEACLKVDNSFTGALFSER